LYFSSQFSAQLSRQPTLARGPPASARAVVFPSPFPRLRPSPASPVAGPAARASASARSAFLFLSAVADVAGPLVRRVPFLKSMPPPDLLFPKTPKPNHFPQSLPSLIGASSGYISRARTPFRLHPTLSQCEPSSRDATAS
jgi:hypothetical protein